MDDDQQFCLRWNNHQSTLISVFDTLLENGTLVDCTLAAEGKFLKAHKVVLSACSPYFAALLSQQYDKHPIFILKDVKFQELRAMMDYMYRGEVNISQDQLAALLKAAESLQIKGLSDSRSSTSSQQQKNEATTSKTLPPPVPAAKASGLTIENKRPLKSLGATDSLDADLSGSREGSTSPTSRKRKKIRRKSIDANIMLDNHDQHSNSSSHSMHTTTAPSLAIQSTTIVASTTGNTNQQHNSATSLSAPSNNVSNVLSVATIKKTENIQQHQQQNDALKLQIQMKQHQDDDDDDEDEDDDDGGDDNDEDDHDDELMENENEMQQQNIKLMNRHQQMDLDNKNISQSELMIEPKNEYDDGHDENVEDLTLDEEELLEDMEQAGPSHGGEGSSQGYAQWQMERAQDEAFMAAQDAVGGQHRDAQGEHVQLAQKFQEERQRISIVSEDVLFNNGARKSPQIFKKCDAASERNNISQSENNTFKLSSHSPNATILPTPEILNQYLQQQKFSIDSFLSKNMKGTYHPNKMIKKPQIVEVNTLPTSLNKTSNISIIKTPPPRPKSQESILTNTGISQCRRQSTSKSRDFIPFKCPLCSLVYRTQAFLNEHMRKEHSVLI